MCGFRTFRLAECLSSLSVKQDTIYSKDLSSESNWDIKVYRICFVSQPKESFLDDIGISYEQMHDAVNETFRDMLNHKLKKLVRSSRSTTHRHSSKLTTSESGKTNKYYVCEPDEYNYSETKNDTDINKNAAKKKKFNCYQKYHNQVTTKSLSDDHQKRSRIDMKNKSIKDNRKFENGRYMFFLDIISELSSSKLLVLDAIKEVVVQTKLNHSIGIKRCYKREFKKPDRFVINTIGLNFQAAWSNSHIVDVCH